MKYFGIITLAVSVLSSVPLGAAHSDNVCEHSTRKQKQNAEESSCSVATWDSQFSDIAPPCPFVGGQQLELSSILREYAYQIEVRESCCMARLESLGACLNLFPAWWKKLESFDVSAPENLQLAKEIADRLLAPRQQEICKQIKDMCLVRDYLHRKKHEVYQEIEKLERQNLTF